jgi:hypothetical protein
LLQNYNLEFGDKNTIEIVQYNVIAVNVFILNMVTKRKNVCKIQLAEIKFFRSITPCIKLGKMRNKDIERYIQGIHK